MLGKKSGSKALVVATPMELLAEAVHKDMDPDKLEKLMTLQERWIANEAKRDYGAALAGFQADCPSIPCTREVTGARGFSYKYAPLDAIQELIRPHLSEWGLSVTFSTKMHTDGYLTAFCRVLQISGHSEVSEFTCPVDKDMAVNDSQRQGSVNSYAKRYALGNALNLTFEREDDDGESGSNKPVDAEQAANIEALVSEVGADRARFLQWAGASVIANILASKYDECVIELERKR